MAYDCPVSSDCLLCPRDKCIYDEDPRSPDRSTLRRTSQAQELYLQGKSPSEVAGVLGVCLKTAYRYRFSLEKGG